MAGRKHGLWNNLGDPNFKPPTGGTDDVDWQVYVATRTERYCGLCGKGMGIESDVSDFEKQVGVHEKCYWEKVGNRGGN